MRIFLCVPLDYDASAVRVQRYPEGWEHGADAWSLLQEGSCSFDITFSKENRLTWRIYKVNSLFFQISDSWMR